MAFSSSLLRPAVLALALLLPWQGAAKTGEATPDPQPNIMAEDARKGAEALAKAVEPLGYKLDFSPESLEELERLLDENFYDGWPRPDGYFGTDYFNKIGQAIFYSGEVAVRAGLAEWDDPFYKPQKFNSWYLHLPDYSQITPASVTGRILIQSGRPGGDTDPLASLAELRERVAAIPANVREKPVRPWFLSSSRAWDVLAELDVQAAIHDPGYYSGDPDYLPARVRGSERQQLQALGTVAGQYYIRLIRWLPKVCDQAGIDPESMVESLDKLDGEMQDAIDRQWKNLDLALHFKTKSEDFLDKEKQAVQVQTEYLAEKNGQTPQEFCDRSKSSMDDFVRQYLFGNFHPAVEGLIAPAEPAPNLLRDLQDAE